ncbi:polysaccharide deacetylase family protein [Streptomyces shaanxiensis]
MRARAHLPLLAAAALAAAGTLTAPATAAPAQAAACSGYVGLTFDDGPGSGTTTLLNSLKQYGLRATMFNTGQNAAANPALVRAQVSAGNRPRAGRPPRRPPRIRRWAGTSTPPVPQGPRPSSTWPGTRWAAAMVRW